MKQIASRLTRPLCMALATSALLAAAAAPAASAAAPKTGTWRGDLVHEFQFFQVTPGAWKPKIVITALDSRILSVVTTVRMECQNPISIQDIRVGKSWRIGTGPKIATRNGAFAFTANGVYFHGTLSKSSAMGGATINRGENCRASARFNAQRGRY
jgi:hypothetical protein